MFIPNARLAILAAHGLIAAASLAQPINESYKIVASNALEQSRFGRTMAIENGLLVCSRSRLANTLGGADLFNISTGNEIRTAGGYGWAIDINNGLIVTSGSENFVEVFEAATGNLVSTLDPVGPESVFGWSVAIDDGIVAVGDIWDYEIDTEAGAAYLFDASTGTELHKLLADDGEIYDYFGWYVELDDGVLAVSAYDDDDNGSNSGSVYLFDVATGTQINKLTPDDGQTGDHFGGAIAIDNGIAAIGAETNDDVGNNAGAVYLFDIATGQQLHKLYPGDTAAMYFGKSVAIRDGLVAVGAPYSSDNGAGSGSAYLFDASTGAQLEKLLPSDGDVLDRFGVSVAVDANTVVVGALRDDDVGEDSGSAYVFLLEDPCPADANGDGMLTPTDFTAWIHAFNNDLFRCDQNNDGACTATDFTAWIANFNAGCN